MKTLDEYKEMSLPELRAEAKRIGKEYKEATQKADSLRTEAIRVGAAIRIKEPRKRVWCQGWEESERGWGTRPDGYSLHLTQEDVKLYIKAYADSLPPEVPDEYSRPAGSPYETFVSASTYRRIQRATGHGIREGGQMPEPITPRKDGWIPIKS